MNIFIIFQLVLLICIFLCLYRIGRGPSAPDRTVALDILGVVIVGFCAILSIETGQDLFMVVAIAWALTGFIASLTLAKFLEGKNFDD